MRTLFVLSLGILALTAGLGTRVQAQSYPWCANYGSAMGGGGTNCGFTTFEQCLATISGIGGFCERNTQYVPTQSRPAPAARPKHS